MTSDKFQVNTFGGGMNTDTDISLMKSHQYLYAENVRIIGDAQNSSGVLLSDNNIKLLASDIIKSNEAVIGVTTLNNVCIIFTKSGDIENPNNRVIRVNFSETGSIINTLEILSGKYMLINNLSLVGNVESANSEKVYFTDGVNSIRVLDVTKPVDASFKIASLDIVPVSNLSEITIHSIISGALRAGKYQYAYQLFNKNGIGTSVSMLSSMVSISNSDVNASTTLGGVSKDVTNKGIALNIAITANTYDMCRLYSLYYASNTEMPTIGIVDDIQIPSNASELTINDTGGNLINIITVSEFNGLTQSEFTTTSLERLNNMLFAANITDSTFDVKNYDTRAYRFNKNGEAILTSNSEPSITIREQNLSTLDTVPENYDCINTSNYDDTYDSGYSYNFTKLGGFGKNISYTFVGARLKGHSKEVGIPFKGTRAIQNDGTVITRSSGNPAFNNSAEFISSTINTDCIVSPETFDTIEILDFKYTPYKMAESPEADDIVEEYAVTKRDVVFSKNKIQGKRDFSNPIIADKFRGYTRGEIYRFGIVFYNKKGIASPVHWIADIKMPSAQHIPIALHREEVSDTFNFENELDLISLGIEFKVDNLPSEVKSYEIVRCKRELQDRTILMQGVLTKCVNPIKDTNKITPGIFVGDSAFGTIYFGGDTGLYSGVVRANHSYGTSRVKELAGNIGNYFSFVSPEVSYNKDGISDVLNNSLYLQTVAVLTSSMRNPEIDNFKPSPTRNLCRINTMGHSKLTSTYENYAAIKNNTVITGETAHLAASTDTYGGSRALFISNRCGTDLVHISKFYNTCNLRGFQFTESEPATYTTPLTYTKYEPTYWQRIMINDIKYLKPLTWSSTQEEIEGSVVAVKDASCINYSTLKVQDALGNYPASTYFPKGPHGHCLIVNTATDLPYIYPRDTPQDYFELRNFFSSVTANPYEHRAYYDYAILTAPLVNIKQNTAPYGGNSNSNIINSVYISTGGKVNIATSDSVICFGGDTYVGIFDYAATMMFEEKDPLTDPDSKRYFGAYIPMESSINFSFKQNVSLKDTTTYTNIKYIQNVAGQMGSHYTQPLPPYTYDDAYSAQPSAKKYISLAKSDKINRKIGNRITNSLAKTNGELTDSWCRFKPLDYLDVDNRYGDITNLKVFNNKLYYWQVNAFGVASVNERSLIKDSNVSSLTLGTAGVLARYDYASTTYGNVVLNDKSIVNSDTTLYWYDFEKKEILGYGGGQLHNLSKVKNIQGLINEYHSDTKGFAVSYHNQKSNELGFKIDTNKTVIFNEALGVFTGVNTIAPPDNIVKLSNNLITISNTDFILYGKNSGNDKYSNVVSKVKFVINNDYEYTKTFDNVFLNGDFTGIDGSHISKVDFKTAVQTSTPLEANDISNREGTYGMYIPRAACQVGDYPERMRGKYLICNYEFSNMNAKSFRVPQIRTTYRYSLI